LAVGAAELQEEKLLRERTKNEAFSCKQSLWKHSRSQENARRARARENRGTENGRNRHRSDEPEGL
jgi:hypothetical protein